MTKRQLADFLLRVLEATNDCANWQEAHERLWGLWAQMNMEAVD